MSTAAKEAPESPPAAARMAMIESQLKPCGIASPAVVAAFFDVAREDFVPAHRRALAYVDAAHPLVPSRELMAPLSLARLVERAQPKRADRALVVGAGTGYAAAVLSRLCGHVVALEADEALCAAARTQLGALPNVEVAQGPLEAGWPAGAPYSLLLVDGAVDQLSQPLIDQLGEGGRAAAIVVGDDGVARASFGRKSAGLLPLEPFAEAPAAVLAPFRRPPGFRF
jgi:protein-L-isoaspartate(D-aspartate) O-methyltransferase